jgi:hypothetical protein
MKSEMAENERVINPSPPIWIRARISVLPIRVSLVNGRGLSPVTQVVEVARKRSSKKLKSPVLLNGIDRKRVPNAMTKRNDERMRAPGEKYWVLLRNIVWVS